MTSIIINEFVIPCIIGVYPEERETVQPVSLNLTLTQNAPSHALEKDEISNLIDYDAVMKTTHQFVSQSQYQTLEALGWHLARHLCETFPPIQQINLILHKPQLVLYGTTPRIALNYERT